MSSPKAKSSVNQQVKARLSAIRDFLAGRSGDEKIAAPEDQSAREEVAAELLRTMSGRSAEDAYYEPADEASSGDARNANDVIPGDGLRKSQSEVEAIPPFDTEPVDSHRGLGTAEIVADAKHEEQERARKLFLDHGYFDEAVRNLGAANSPAARAAAARTLGLVNSQRATPHLVAAMFDEDEDVRSAAEEALNQIGDPAVTKVGRTTDASEKTVDASVAESAEDHEIGRDARASSEQIEAEPQTGSTEEKKPVVPQSDAPPTETSALSGEIFVSTSEAEQPEENRIRETVAQLARQSLETATARQAAEQEFRRRSERETALRAEAAARRSDEQQLRQRADEEAERRRLADNEAVAVEQVAAMKAESEAQRLAADETSLRLKAADFRLAGEKLARAREDREAARRESAAATRLADATRSRDEAESRHESELHRLRQEEEVLRTRTGEIAQSHAEVEAAREKADAEAARLFEARGRMREAEAARVQAEQERARLETQINQQVETALRLLEETRRRGQEEQDRVQEETRRHTEVEQRRLAELEAMSNRVQEESKQLAEKERHILAELDTLKINDAETRRRIEEAAVRRRAAEDAYRLVAEKVQRVEAEAHARAKEEDQMLAKLEAERRAVAVDAQLRAAQEKRIKEEIELFRKLEEQERPRVEEAALQLAAAAARFQERQAPADSPANPDVLASGAAQPNVAQQYQEDLSANFGETDQHRAALKPPSTLALPGDETATGANASAVEYRAELRAPANEDDSDIARAEHVNNDERSSVVTPSIVVYLNSVDPYKRAAAVAELARSRPQDAFSLITNCFDDHSPHVRNAAARAFRKLEPTRTVDLFNKALEEASAERRRNIGGAIAASGLASEAIENLVSENREDTYNALSILFVMAKTGEVEPLVRALAEHPNDEIGKAVTKLLTLSGHSTQ